MSFPPHGHFNRTSVRHVLSIKQCKREPKNTAPQLTAKLNDPAFTSFPSLLNINSISVLWSHSHSVAASAALHYGSKWESSMLPPRFRRFLLLHKPPTLSLSPFLLLPVWHVLLAWVTGLLENRKISFMYLFSPLCGCRKYSLGACVCTCVWQRSMYVSGLFHKKNVQHPTRVCYNISMYHA